MLELEHRFRVVDVHVTLEPDESRRPRGMGDPEQIEREMHQAGIVQSLALPETREDEYLRVNNAVARVAVDRPFTAFARINGVREPGTGTGSRLRNVARSRGDHHTSPDDIEQYAYEGRFEGFVIDPVSDGLPDAEVLEALESVDRPVITYGGTEFPAETIEETLLPYDFPLIIAHCGGYALDEELTNRTIDLLDSYDSCYVDTSFVRLRDPLERAVMEHPDRVLFGSGAPAAHPNVAVMEILTLDVPEDAMRKVFWKNAARVIESLAP
ncbi:amidohydrolase family protein [Halovenus salina]|uniref:amidohydrolase family protein n=1 Tax=Halovenus salina TaxID=1510225 RepID=UPI002261004E|nr:amidohydrolase family protein [Halovenus salina]